MDRDRLQPHHAARPSTGGSASASASGSASEAVDIFEDMAKLLQTGLSRNEVKSAVHLVQMGYSHGAVAKTLEVLKAEAANTYRQQQEQQQQQQQQQQQVAAASSDS